MINSASKWAKKLLERDNFLVLDLETTGLIEDTENKMGVVQVTLMSPAKRVVFSSFIDPCFPIPEGASETHNIYDKDVEGAPTLDQIVPFLHSFLSGKEVVAYNAAFDITYLTTLTGKLPVDDIHCVMERFSDFSGSRFYDSLPNLSGATAHDSTVDCLNTLLLIERMAGIPEKDSIDLDF